MRLCARVIVVGNLPLRMRIQSVSHQATLPRDMQQARHDPPMDNREEHVSPSP